MPVTVIEAGPCVVTQVKTRASDGYGAVQLGFGAQKPKNTPAAHAGPFPQGRYGPAADACVEFRLEDGHSYKLGDHVDVSAARGVARVDVTGITKGRGFRAASSGTASTAAPPPTAPRTCACPARSACTPSPGRVLPGTHMAGQYGNKQRDEEEPDGGRRRPERNLLLVTGSVPGHQQRHRVHPAQPVSSPVLRAAENEVRSWQRRSSTTAPARRRATVDLPACALRAAGASAGALRGRALLPGQPAPGHPRHEDPRRGHRLRPRRLFRQKGTGRARAGPAPQRRRASAAASPSGRIRGTTPTAAAQDQAAGPQERAQRPRGQRARGVVEDFELDVPKTDGRGRVSEGNGPAGPSHPGGPAGRDGRRASTSRCGTSRACGSCAAASSTPTRSSGPTTWCSPQTRSAGAEEVFGS